MQIKFIVKLKKFLYNGMVEKEIHLFKYKHKYVVTFIPTFFIFDGMKFKVDYTEHNLDNDILYVYRDLDYMHIQPSNKETFEESLNRFIKNGWERD